MGIYNKFKTNRKLETEGIFYEGDTYKIKLARAGGSNQAFNAAMERFNTEHGRAIKNNLLSNDKALELMANAYADTVVLDWQTKVDDKWQQGIEQPDGSIAPFNRENVVRILIDVPDLFMELQAIASNHQLYLQSILDSAVKN